MSEEYSLDIAAWLSELSSDTSFADSNDQDTPTKIRKKRKRRLSDHSSPSTKQSGLRYPLTKDALAETSPNIMNPPTGSPQKRDGKKIETVMTPKTNATKVSYNARSRPPTVTPSSSSRAIKRTANEANIRMDLAAQNMFFEDEGSFERYAEFKDHIEKMVFGTRGSAMRTESVKAIKHWRAANATNSEKAFFAEAIPMILKDARGVVPTNKRTFDGEIVHQATSFAEDGLGKQEDCSFVKSILPLRMEQAEVGLGLTNPKPDFVFGLVCPRYPDPDAPVLSEETKALIEVAPGLKHAFFAVENKGCQNSIEAAENQAMRAGATLVAAMRALQRKAKGMSSIGVAIDPAAPLGTSTDNPATVNTVAPDLPVNGDDEEDLGADTSSFAFTCSWVPQLANLHVHWCERRPNGHEIYHMNLLSTYVMIRPTELTDFRRDVHNILDWGIGPERKESLKALERDIARHGRGEK